MIEDYNILKLIPSEELYELLPKGFKFYTKPWDHQVPSTLACIAEDGFLLQLDLGTGKTKVIIDTLRHLLKTRKKLNVIVLCTGAAVDKWAEEVRMHADTLSVVVLNSIKLSKEERIGMLCNTAYNVRVMSIERFRASCTERIPSGIGNKRKEVISSEVIQRIIKSKLDVLVIDESHKIKDPGTITFEICAALSYSVKYRYLLTGTAFHKLQDIWAQYYVVDQGETFGKSYRSFLKKYFVNKPKYIRRAGIEISNWKVTPEGEKEIMRLMYRKSIRYDENEVKGMPEKIFETLRFDLPVKQDYDYRKLVDLSASKEYTGNQNFFTVFRQICSGFIISTGKFYDENPKIDFLQDIAEQVVERDKLVVFHEFDMEYDLISKLFKKMKIDFCEINGRTKDKGEQNRRFLKEDKYRAIIVNTKSGAESIDLQVARYAVFFSSPLSVPIRKQAIKRIHRGQITRTRFYYDFVAKKTVESTIHRNLAAGVDVFDQAMDPVRIMKALLGEL